MYKKVNRKKKKKGIKEKEINSVLIYYKRKINKSKI